MEKRYSGGKKKRSTDEKIHCIKKKNFFKSLNNVVL